MPAWIVTGAPPAVAVGSPVVEAGTVAVAVAVVVAVAAADKSESDERTKHASY